MRPPARRYLIVDVEATTSDARSVLEDETETVEIGAVLVDGRTFAPEAEFQSYVRPVRHPLLMPFCTLLTGIRQATVDAAPGFPAVMDALGRALLRDREGLVFGAWGDFDRRQIRRDCRFHGVAYPFRRHLDLKEMFSKAQLQKRRYGLANALAHCGLEPQGAAHRALDDARNVARLLPWIVGGRMASRG